MVIPADRETFRYSGGPPAAWLREAVNHIGENYESLFEQLDRAAQTEVDVESFLGGTKLPRRMRDEALLSYEHEPTPTAWGVVNAITRFAREESNHVRRRFIESIAGGVANGSYCGSCSRPL